jgi:hypothetical protein
VRPRDRCKKKMKMHVTEISCEIVDRILLSRNSVSLCTRVNMTDEQSRVIRGGEFFDKLKDYQLPKKNICSRS